MMSAPDRKARIGLLVYGTGAAIGLHIGLLHALIVRSFRGPASPGGLSIPGAIVVFVGGSLVFSTATYVLWRWVFPRLGGRSMIEQVVIQAAVCFVAIGALSVLSVEMVTAMTGAPSPWGPAVGTERHLLITPEMRQTAARLYVFLPIVPSMLLTLIGYHQHWRRILTLHHRERELTELAATAQLAALRAQINPHFLFNSLNSIAQLIHTDPDTAERCVERLADLFRYILHRAEKEFVPLADELAMVDAYLEIERARFGERLRVETDLEPRSLAHPIPSLLLQPLIENAVKHGLARKVGTGTVRIAAQLNDGQLTLSVGDDGLGMSPTALASVYDRGVGLRNLRDRMARLYGPTHAPEIVSQAGHGTEVRLRLPVRAADAA
jgi:signal transduction histidine kinase